MALIPEGASIEEKYFLQILADDFENLNWVSTAKNYSQKVIFSGFQQKSLTYKNRECRE